MRGSARLNELAAFTVHLDTEIVSINRLYKRARNAVFLSNEGKALKSKLTQAVQRATQALPWQRVIESVYGKKAKLRLTITIHTPRYWNQSWRPGGRTASGALQSPYQRIDATNFAKIIEDGITDGTGIDDSLHHDVRYRLKEGASYGVTIKYVVYETDKNRPG